MMIPIEKIIKEMIEREYIGSGEKEEAARLLCEGRNPMEVVYILSRVFD